MAGKGIRGLAAVLVLGAIVATASQAGAGPAGGIKRWARADLYVLNHHTQDTYWYDTYSIAAVQVQDPVNGTSTLGILGKGSCVETVEHNALDRLGFVTWSDDCTTTMTSQPIAASAFQIDQQLNSASVRFDSDRFAKGGETEHGAWTTYDGPAVYPELGNSWPSGTPDSVVGAGVVKFATMTGRLAGYDLATSTDSIYSFGDLGEGVSMTGIPPSLLHAPGKVVIHQHRTFVRS